MKKCVGCKKKKSLSNFYRRKDSRGLYTRTSAYCKICDKTRGKAGTIKLKKKDPLGFYKKNRNNELARRYGITLEDYEIMLKNQNGRCYICKTKALKHSSGYPVLAVDHDNKTGEIRGLLCRPCNVAIGIFKHDIQIIQRAIEYLAAGK